MKPASSSPSAAGSGLPRTTRDAITSRRAVVAAPLLFALLALAPLLAVAPPAMAATRTWDSHSGAGCLQANWSTAGCWAGNVLPVTGDDVAVSPGSGGGTAADVPANYDLGSSIQLHSITLNPASTYNITGGPIVFQSGGFITDNSNNSNADSFSSGITLNGPATFTLGVSPITETLSFNGAVTGTGGLTVVNNAANAGTLTLSGVNTYSNGTTISAGTLVAAHATAGAIDALGSGDITMNGGALRATVTGTFTNNLIFNDNTASVVSAAPAQTLTFGPNGGASFITLGDGSTATFGSPTDTGTVVISSDFNNIFASARIIVAGGTLRDGNGTLGNATSFITSTTVNAVTILDMNDQTDGIHNLLGAGTVIIGTNGATTLFLLSGDQTTGGFGSHLFSGVITGPGSVEVGPVGTGGGETILTGANLYAGGTFIQPTDVLQLGNGGTTGSILGDVTFLPVSSDQPVPGQLVFDRSNTYVFDGSISGPGIVEQVGTGETVLTGVSTYTGATTVNAGTLAVNGSIVSPVTVNSGGTLAGTGTISNTVTVNSGGTLSPGSSPGIINMGSLTLTSGSTLIIELNGTTVGSQYDQVNVTGAVNLGGATLNVTPAFVPPPGSVFIIVNNDLADPVIGTFAGLPEGATFTAGGQRFSISYVGGTGNDITLAALTPIAQVPTLSSLGLLLLGLAVAALGAMRLRSYGGKSLPHR